MYCPRYLLCAALLIAGQLYSFSFELALFWPSKTTFLADNFIKLKHKEVFSWDVVVAQFEERSHLTPKVQGSNPVIAKFILNVHCQLY